MKNFLLLIAGLIFLWVTWKAVSKPPTRSVVAETPIPEPSPIATSAPATSGVKVLKAIYDTDGYFKPRKFQVKAGSKVRLEVLAKIDGEGCMGSIMVPDFSEEVYGFEQGKTVAFEFTPQTPGEYAITCAMGIPHGVIEVI